jgi:hypothetical protein
MRLDRDLKDTYGLVINEEAMGGWGCYERIQVAWPVCFVDLRHAALQEEAHAHDAIGAGRKPCRRSSQGPPWVARKSPLPQEFLLFLP